jgi:hypothetical protein
MLRAIRYMESHTVITRFIIVTRAADVPGGGPRIVPRQLAGKSAW